MLAITGGKGGCGKTTTALGLGRALDADALVVDADWDLPDLHALAGVDRGWTDRPDAAAHGAHGIDGTDGADSAVVDSAAAARRVSDGVAVLPAPERSSERTGSDLQDVESVLAAARAFDGAVLVDCPAGAAPDAVAPLRAADAALLVAEPCAATLRDAAKTAAMARAVGTPVVGAVLTRATAVPAGVDAALNCPVLGRVPRAPPPVLESAAVAAAYRRVASALGTAASTGEGGSIPTSGENGYAGQPR
ncbi:MinD/ParA family ATP-binding protein [Halobaculum sp. D14]|uniref:MinD/ParA family ATP-binding protein n=1 Tax=Halobaculum sp. D14 TaxID=3421642 RepID=UPI003EBCB04F